MKILNNSISGTKAFFTRWYYRIFHKSKCVKIDLNGYKPKFGDTFVDQSWTCYRSLGKNWYFVMKHIEIGSAYVTREGGSSKSVQSETAIGKPVGAAE